MSQNTPNYSLIKPDVTDNADLTIFVGQNMDIIDTKMQDLQNQITSGNAGSGSASSNPVSLSGIRYIRDTTNGSSVNGNSYWSEIQAVDNTSTNQALNKTVTSSSAPIANTLPVVTDGTIGNSTGQYVALTTGPQWVMIDLGALYNITSVSIYRYWLDSRIFHGILTEVSDNGTDWYTIYDSTVDGEYVETSSGKTVSVDITHLYPTRILAMNSSSAFMATPSAILAVATSVGRVNFNTKVYDNQAEYDSTTNYRFTAKASGIYLVDSSIRTAATSTSAGIQMFLYKNGVNTYQLGHVYSSTSIVTLANSIIVKLSAGDYLEIYAQSATALTTTNGISPTGSWFSAVKLV